MACNFNFANIATECTNVAGIRAVSLLPKSAVTKITYGATNKVEKIDTTGKWGQISVKPGKGGIALAATVDPKKNIYLNVYTLTFSVNKFNANILAGDDFKAEYMVDEVYAAVLLNNGKAYLVGDAGEDGVTYEDCRFTTVASNTGAAMGDASTTDYTIKFTTNKLVSEIELAKLNTLFTGNNRDVIDEPAAAAKA